MPPRNGTRTVGAHRTRARPLVRQRAKRLDAARAGDCARARRGDEPGARKNTDARARAVPERGAPGAHGRAPTLQSSAGPPRCARARHPLRVPRLAAAAHRARAHLGRTRHSAGADRITAGGVIVAVCASADAPPWWCAPAPPSSSISTAANASPSRWTTPKTPHVGSTRSSPARSSCRYLQRGHRLSASPLRTRGSPDVRPNHFLKLDNDSH